MNNTDREILDKLQLDITEIKQMMRRIMYSLIKENYPTDINHIPYEPIKKDRNPFEPIFWKEKDLYQE